jgi:hypothetical protein
VRNVALVSVSYTDREPIERHIALLCQMKNRFVAVRDEALRIDRFEMTNGNFVATTRFDSDRFDPVKGVLQNEFVPQGDDNFMRQHRIAWRGANVEEERAVRFQQSFHFTAPFNGPLQVRFPRHGVAVSTVADAKIVGGDVTTTSTDSEGSSRIRSKRSP